MVAYFVKLYLSMLLAFLAVDLLWLGVVARDFYRKHLGALLSPTPNWPAALIFYALFIAGLLAFVVAPAVQAGSLRQALLMGAFFGLVAYATYDLTNLATLRDWPFTLTVADLIWGTVLSTAVSAVGFYVGRWLS